MASYSVAIKPSAGKELETIGQKKDRERIVNRIRSLAEDPRPHGCEKLSGPSGLHRIRVGTYRVLYAINDTEARIQVIKIGHRKDAYS